MSERLQKILSERGVASRRASERLITEGRVTVNGRVAALGESADAQSDEICVDGVPLPSAPKCEYIMLNKPRGFVTTVSDDRGRRTVMELVSDCGAKVYPVGRLDMDSEGLLLLTNDGELANRLMHPSFEVQKTYRVLVDAMGEQLERAAARLREPMEIDGVTVTAKQILVQSAALEITIGEGRNRQIRRMCAAAGLRVQRLTRVAEGGLRLGDLRVGRWRRLTDAETELLRKGE